MQNISGPAGFILFSTHSLPVQFEDINLDQPLSDEIIAPATDRWFARNNSRTGANASGTFNISYISTALGNNNSTTVYTNNIIGFSRIPRYVIPQPGLSDAWDDPFFMRTGATCSTSPPARSTETSSTLTASGS